MINDGGCWFLAPDRKLETEWHDVVYAKNVSEDLEAFSTYKKGSPRIVSVFYSCLRPTLSSYILAIMADITLRTSKALVSEHFSLRLLVLGSPENYFVFILFQELCRDERNGSLLLLAFVRFSSVFAIFYAQHFSSLLCPGKE